MSNISIKPKHYCSNCRDGVMIENENGRLECDKCETRLYYHVFTDGVDDFFYDYSIAQGYFDHLKKRGRNVRLYESFEDKDEDDTWDGECLDSFGAWPY